MLTQRQAQIASETLVDVATPGGAVGVIEQLSTRDGIEGATVSIGNPLEFDAAGWYPLANIELCGDSARKVVARYL